MTLGLPPPAPGLPPGFVVRLNHRVRVRDEGRALIGGAPTRVLYLTDTARRMFTGRTLRVTDQGTRVLADRLLELGLADPVVDELAAPDECRLTFVVPVFDRPAALKRLLASIGPGSRVIVVDDASTDPDASARVAAAHGARLVALPENLGPAGARNAGLRLVETSHVAFVDCDVVLEPRAMETLLRHFQDPRVAIAAPRILGLDAADATWIGRYEDARSSLDLGRHPGIVRPRAPVSWLPGACLVARVDALGDGFSADLRVAEDVDLVWRLAAAGWRIRFEPTALVRHEHREEAGDWLARKAYYGTGAHALALRHPRDIAPAILAPWSVGVILALLAQRRWSLPVAAAISLVAAARITAKLGRSRNPARTGASLAVQGVSAALSQAGALLLRHWWPLTFVGCLFSRRLRRAALVAGLLDVVLEYRRTEAQLDPLRFGLARRLDDLAYGAGVWFGAIRGRSPAALIPDLRGRA